MRLEIVLILQLFCFESWKGRPCLEANYVLHFDPLNQFFNFVISLKCYNFSLPSLNLNFLITTSFIWIVKTNLISLCRNLHLNVFSKFKNNIIFLNCLKLCFIIAGGISAGQQIKVVGTGGQIIKATTSGAPNQVFYSCNLFRLLSI
jgi:hypothetical protein